MNRFLSIAKSARSIKIIPPVRMMSSKTFDNFSQGDLKFIGYHDAESRWITSMRDAYTNGFILNPSNYQKVDNCGHSGGSFVYTKVITDNIKKNNFDEWKENFLHLNYSDLLNLFYFTGFQRAGNHLISHNFKKSGNKENLDLFRTEYGDDLSDKMKITLLKKLISSTKFE